MDAVTDTHITIDLGMIIAGYAVTMLVVSLVLLIEGIRDRRGE